MFTIFVILLMGIVALILSLGFYVKNLDTVFPNVWAEGIKLSGLTFEEARQTLISEGYESNAQGVSATVIFPDGDSFTITGEDAGLALDAEDAATAAFQYGRGGSFLASEISYVKALLDRTELRDLSLATMDTVMIREVVAEHTKKFNDTLIDDVRDISGDSIVFVKGTGVEPADEDAVYDLTVETLNRAMVEKANLTSEYFPQKSESQDVDLELIYNMIRVDPVSSEYDPETHGATDSSIGISFDLDAAQAKFNRAGMGERIEIPLITVEPEIKKEDIESLLFRDVLATRTTNIAGTSNRLNNIVLSSQAIDGTILNPEEVFSFNGIVGQRTTAKGYKEAGAYVGGRVVQEVGGGICQTSSTIYDCVLHADLKVLERSAHRFTVSYLPLGNDATINWGTIDFKFKNSTEYPIRIEAVVNGRELTVKLIGTKFDDTYIKLDYVTISRTPYEVIRKEDPSVTTTTVDTSGYNGYVVDTYKYLYDGDNNLISKTLVGRSTYRTQDRVILIPVGSGENPDGQPTPTPTPTTDPTQPSVTPTPIEPGTTDPTTEPTPEPTPGGADPEPTGSPSEPTPTDPGTEEPPDPARQEPDE